MWWCVVHSLVGAIIACMAKRDLLEDMKRLKPHSKAGPATSVIGAIGAQRRSRSPPQRNDEFTIAELSDATSPSYTRFTINVSLDDDTADRLIMDGDLDAATSAQVIQGEYHCLSDQFGGRPIWRQEFPTAPGDIPLFIFYTDSKTDPGWYAADQIMDSKHRTDYKGTIHAYFGGNESMPGPAHVPYWAKKKSLGIVVEPLVHYLQRRLAELVDNPPWGSAMPSLTSAMDDTIDLRSEFYEAMEKRAEDAEARNAEYEMRFDEMEAGGKSDGKSDGVCGKSEGKASGKGKDKEAGHGGYAPKLAKMVSAIYKKDWTSVNKQAKLHYTSPLIKKLCDLNDRGKLG
jgi:hypothetical protein